MLLGWLGTALASHGYIVAAVNHPGNNGVEPYTVRGFSTWWERARDLNVVIDNLLTDPTLGSHIDNERIGAAGFSLGGYAMIEIAGGITDPAAFKEFCASPRADGICKSPPEFPTLVEDFAISFPRAIRTFKPLCATEATRIAIRAFMRSWP